MTTLPTDVERLDKALHSIPEWDCGCSGAYDQRRHAEAVYAHLVYPGAPGGVHNHGTEHWYGAGINCPEYLIGECRLTLATQPSPEPLDVATLDRGYCGKVWA